MWKYVSLRLRKKTLPLLRVCRCRAVAVRGGLHHRHDLLPPHGPQRDRPAALHAARPVQADRPPPGHGRHLRGQACELRDSSTVSRSIAVLMAVLFAALWYINTPSAVFLVPVVFDQAFPLGVSVVVFLPCSLIHDKQFFSLYIKNRAIDFASRRLSLSLSLYFVPNYFQPPNLAQRTSILGNAMYFMHVVGHCVDPSLFSELAVRVI